MCSKNLRKRSFTYFSEKYFVNAIIIIPEGRLHYPDIPRKSIYR